MGIQAVGIEAEQWALEMFRKKGIKVFQPDGISLENGAYVLNEVKHQEQYNAPPFDGHGLPLWQVKARMDFYNQTGIRCRLIVKEKDKDIVYWQWLDDLEAIEYFDTKGMKPRRVYNLEFFNNFTTSNIEL